MIAPTKVIVGCSTAGLEDQEGKVMRITLPYGLLVGAVIGLTTWSVIAGQGSGGDQSDLFTSF